jgi:hypothetical protein
LADHDGERLTGHGIRHCSGTPRYAWLRNALPNGAG